MLQGGQTTPSNLLLREHDRQRLNFQPVCERCRGLKFPFIPGSRTVVFDFYAEAASEKKIAGSKPKNGGHFDSEPTAGKSSL